ncbi:heme exporter protein CcmD [Halorhodospira abdelmalekii]|uniref:heme exporter protein CcmD n=1 Tax=Halorhodospira abdelmalekii TaxID=421629 RepID=UPI00190362A4|nr:heme exporter protein CcmD [Halorhodospira abdelmalekii]MBK1734757.1 heme exporter protein CcmD [Halorhodospira abdelmalekii]
MWDGIGDFLAMGGHAPYVWGSFGMVAAIILCEWLLLRRRRQRTHARLSRRARTSNTSS